MKFKQLIFVLLVQLFITSTAVSPIPVKCWLWDSPCLTVKAQSIFSILAAGVPDLDIQPLDTIQIDFIHLDQDGFREDLRSIKVKGMTDAVVDRVSVDMPSKIVNLVFHTDFVTRSRYINNGTLLSTPIEGDGDFFMKLENVQIAMSIPFDIIKDAHNNDVMTFKSFDYIFDVRNGAQFNLENLYNGDKYLSDDMHNKLHQNWKYLTIVYAKYLLDPVTTKVFTSFRNYIRSEPLGTVALYTFQ